MKTIAWMVFLVAALMTSTRGLLCPDGQTVYSSEWDAIIACGQVTQSWEYVFADAGPGFKVSDPLMVLDTASVTYVGNVSDYAIPSALHFIDINYPIYTQNPYQLDLIPLELADFLTTFVAAQAYSAGPEQYYTNNLMGAGSVHAYELPLLCRFTVEPLLSKIILGEVRVFAPQNITGYSVPLVAAEAAKVLCNNWIVLQLDAYVQGYSPFASVNASANNLIVGGGTNVRSEEPLDPTAFNVENVTVIIDFGAYILKNTSTLEQQWCEKPRLWQEATIFSLSQAPEVPELTPVQIEISIVDEGDASDRCLGGWDPVSSLVEQACSCSGGGGNGGGGGGGWKRGDPTTPAHHNKKYCLWVPREPTWFSPYSTLVSGFSNAPQCLSNLAWLDRDQQRRRHQSDPNPPQFFGFGTQSLGPDLQPLLPYENCMDTSCRQANLIAPLADWDCDACSDNQVGFVSFHEDTLEIVMGPQSFNFMKSGVQQHSDQDGTIYWTVMVDAYTLMGGDNTPWMLFNGSPGGQLMGDLLAQYLGLDPQQWVSLCNNIFTGVSKLQFTIRPVPNPTNDTVTTALEGISTEVDLRAQACMAQYGPNGTTIRLFEWDFNSTYYTIGNRITLRCDDHHCDREVHLPVGSVTQMELKIRKRRDSSHSWKHNTITVACWADVVVLHVRLVKDEWVQLEYDPAQVEMSMAFVSCGDACLNAQHVYVDHIERCGPTTAPTPTPTSSGTPTPTSSGTPARAPTKKSEVRDPPPASPPTNDWCQSQPSPDWCIVPTQEDCHCNYYGPPESDTASQLACEIAEHYYDHNYNIPYCTIGMIDGKPWCEGEGLVESLCDLAAGDLRFFEYPCPADLSFPSVGDLYEWVSVTVNLNCDGSSALRCISDAGTSLYSLYQPILSDWMNPTFWDGQRDPLGNPLLNVLGWWNLTSTCDTPPRSLYPLSFDGQLYVNITAADGGHTHSFKVPLFFPTEDVVPNPINVRTVPLEQLSDLILLDDLMLINATVDEIGFVPALWGAPEPYSPHWTIIIPSLPMGPAAHCDHPALSLNGFEIFQLPEECRPDDNGAGGNSQNGDPQHPRGAGKCRGLWRQFQRRLQGLNGEFASFSTCASGDHETQWGQDGCGVFGDDLDVYGTCGQYECEDQDGGDQQQQQQQQQPPNGQPGGSDWPQSQHEDEIAMRCDIPDESRLDRCTQVNLYFTIHPGALEQDPCPVLLANMDALPGVMFSPLIDLVWLSSQGVSSGSPGAGQGLQNPPYSWYPSSNYIWWLSNYDEPAFTHPLQYLANKWNQGGNMNFIVGCSPVNHMLPEGMDAAQAFLQGWTSSGSANDAMFAELFTPPAGPCYADFGRQRDEVVASLDDPIDVSVDLTCSPNGGECNFKGINITRECLAHSVYLKDMNEEDGHHRHRDGGDSPNINIYVNVPRGLNDTNSTVVVPSGTPSGTPSATPTGSPTGSPTNIPSIVFSNDPTLDPTNAPTSSDPSNTIEDGYDTVAHDFEHRITALERSGSTVAIVLFLILILAVVGLLISVFVTF